MLTALTIEDKRQKKIRAKLKNRIKGNVLLVRKKTAGQVKLLHFHYIYRTGKINWEEIFAALSPKPCSLLYKEKWEIPLKADKFIYRGNSFAKRLAENAGIAVLEYLKEGSKEIVVGVLDKTAKSRELVELLLQFTGNLIVVSDKRGEYEQLNESMLNKYGVAFSLEEETSKLACCHMIIAPQKIKTPVFLKSNTIVFCGSPPGCSLCAMVFDSYSVTLPEMYKQIKPQGLAEEYFAQALFEQENQYFLENYIPDLCYRNGIGSTIEEIGNIIHSRVKNT